MAFKINEIKLFLRSQVFCEFEIAMGFMCFGQYQSVVINPCNVSYLI